MHRIRSHAHVSRHGSKGDQGSILPLSNTPSNTDGAFKDRPGGRRAGAAGADAGDADGAEPAEAARPPSDHPPPESKEQGEAPAAITGPPKKSVVTRFFLTVKKILLCSIFNVLLVFVPVGIALAYLPVKPYITFAINAIAIIPLAGLLAHATESVAVSLGDALGALLNVTFGNAVELIIFIIALTKDEIRIVQASLVGSILANLLLILGMCFLFGGLRFREQIYNSTVTQMSACLLSLSVTSLVLPTAFHASFNDSSKADSAVLDLSRASSIILLLVYILYLLFQLKSHAYMYESTPQHVIDEESHPGVLANMLNSSSSSDSSSTSDSDTTSSSVSGSTANRLKKAFRRRRKSSVSSKDSPSIPSTNDTPHVKSPLDEATQNLDTIGSGDEADTERKINKSSSKSSNGVQFRDFENEQSNSPQSSKHKKHKHRYRKHRGDREERRAEREERRGRKEGKSERSSRRKDKAEKTEEKPADTAPSKGVAFEDDTQQIPHSSTEPSKRPFAMRTISVRPAIPKILTSTVFSAENPSSGSPAPRGSSVPRAPYGLRRTSSLPDRLNRGRSVPRTNSGPGQPGPPLAVATTIAEKLDEEDEGEETLSRTSAIILLLVSTGLVALCADALVESINYMVNSTPISEAGIGLIILPIVGNAAEHVTAVTVATKNKMDLAIGVAIGSSIQIALFVTPLVVLLGWIMSKPMSLYFTLFETVSLFVSAFIINFLILDGRSNYLEGALLMAGYIIIAVAAFFYPDRALQSEIGGGDGSADAAVHAVRSLGSMVGLGG